MRRLHIYVLILLFILLIVSIETQRGRSRSSSRSSFGRSKSTSYGKKVNKLDANNTRQYTEEQKKNGETFIKVFMTIFCMVAFYIVYNILSMVFGSFFSGNTKKQTVQQRFQIIKTTKNIVNYEIITMQQYCQKRDNFVKMISVSIDQNAKNVFSFMQNFVQKKISNAKIKVMSENQFIDTIQLQGQDYKGSWKAKGFIMAKLNSVNQSFIYSWWKKDYVNTEIEAGKIQNTPFLIYQTYDVKQDEIKGKWYYQSKDRKYKIGKSGRWFVRKNNIYKQHET